MAAILGIYDKEKVLTKRPEWDKDKSPKQFFRLEERGYFLRTEEGELLFPNESSVPAGDGIHSIAQFDTKNVHPALVDKLSGLDGVMMLDDVEVKLNPSDQTRLKYAPLGDEHMFYIAKALAKK